VLLALFAVVYVLPMQPVGCNQTAHYSLVESIYDGSPRIDRYRTQSCDVSFIDGHYYTAKAPGLALASMPWFVVLKAVGAVPANPALGRGFPAAMVELPRRAIWQMRLWGALVPSLILLWLVFRVAEKWTRGAGPAVTVFLGLGTLLLPFATDYFAHPLSAMLGFAAFAFVFRERSHTEPSLPLLAAAGALAGLAITVEHPLGIVAIVLAVYALLRSARLARACAYGGGLLVGALPLALFNWWAFGSPFRLAYENAVIDVGKSGHDVVGANSSGFFGVRYPDLRIGLELLFSPKGLLVLTPIVAVGAAGTVLLYRRGWRAEALVIATISVLFLIYNASYATPFGGFVPGPRFLIPMLPFLLVALAPVTRSYPATTLALGTVSIVAMVGATAAEPMLGTDDTPWGAEMRGHAYERMAGGSVRGPVCWRSPLLVSSLYILVCRLLGLVVLIARGNRAKGWRFSCCGTSCPFFAGRWPGPASSSATGCCSRR